MFFSTIYVNNTSSLQEVISRRQYAWVLMVIDGVLDIRPQMGSPHSCEEEEKH